jgi:putative addiction module component (TIGR02574 family)
VLAVKFQQVLDAALKLSESERAQVVQRLLHSLGPDAESVVDQAWAVELDRRLTEFQQGAAHAVPWSELKART